MKLLDRTVLAYLVISVCILLIATPVFYFVLNRLFIRNVDETLTLRKQFILHKLPEITSEEQIRGWTYFEDDVEITLLAENQLVRDSVYYVSHQDAATSEKEPFRALQTQVSINGKPHRLVIRVSLLENEDLIQTIVVSQAVLLVALLTGLLILNRRISLRIWQPFYETLESLKNYSLARNNRLAFRKTPVTEFTELNLAIDKMTEKIHSDYISLKQFTENASHETQTPLAIIKSKLEVMIQDEALSPEQMHSLQTIYAATGRLSRLNQGLLLLAKIENRQFSDTELLNLKTMIEEKLVLFEDMIKAKNLNVELHLLDKKIRMNRSLAWMLLTNLIGNAIKYNAVNGLLKIQLTDSQFTISNPGTPPKEQTRLFFERFRKATPGSESLGLGLAIVKEICDFEHFEIGYEYENSLHTLQIRF